MIFSQWSNLSQRLIVGSIASVFLLIVIYLAPHPFFKPVCAAAVAAVISAALWEYYQIAKAKKYSPLVKIGIGFSVLYIATVYLSTQFSAAATFPFLALSMAFLTAFLYFFCQDNNPLVNLAITVFGLVYLAIPLGFSLSILYFFPETALQDGRWWLIYAIAVTKMTDAGAFFTGKKWGKHPLATHISPKKTREGAIGGLLCAVLSSIIFSLSSTLPLTLWQSIYLGITIGLLAQIGDLGESLLKRDAGIKDSNQLPGLGGMLDIVDSLIFTIPFVYFFLRIQY